MAKSATAQVDNTDPSPGLILFCAVCYLACLFLSKSWTGLLSLAIIGLATQLLLGIRLKQLFGDLRKSWLILTFTFIVHWAVNSHYLDNSGDRLIYYFSKGQALVALRFTFRFALILNVFSGMNRMHDMQRYGRSIGRILTRLPFGSSFFSKIELITTLALRMIPFVQTQYSRLNYALATRGETKTSGILGQIAQFRRLLFPLMTQSIRRADKTAIALQIRGYDPSIRRTVFHESTIPVRALLAGLVFISFSLVTLGY